MTGRPKVHSVPQTLHRTGLSRSLALLVVAAGSLFTSPGTLNPLPVLAAPLAQFGLSAGPGVSVTGEGEASVPAETAKVQLLLILNNVFDEMMGEPPEMTELVPSATPESSSSDDAKGFAFQPVRFTFGNA